MNTNSFKAHRRITPWYMWCCFLVLFVVCCKIGYEVYLLSSFSEWLSCLSLIFFIIVVPLTLFILWSQYHSLSPFHLSLEINDKGILMQEGEKSKLYEWGNIHNVAFSLDDMNMGNDQAVTHVRLWSRNSFRIHTIGQVYDKRKGTYRNYYPVDEYSFSGFTCTKEDVLNAIKQYNKQGL